MTTTYTAPYVDATGPHIPNYDQILNGNLVPAYLAIFGADSYLGADSKDYEIMGIFALAVSDAIQAGMGAYQARSPSTAVGIGLDAVCKINGLSRAIPTYSSAIVTCIGQAGTVIANGIIEDINGVQWNLPASVVIPLSGTISVTATCNTIGAIVATANTINKIATPQMGWQTANNMADASQGAPVQSDYSLRVEQTSAVSSPAKAIADGIRGGLLDIPGVAQVVVHVNSTGAVDSDGVPAHSIAAIVLGGDAVAIANSIYLRIAAGITSYGTVSETVLDSYGVGHAVSFSPPTSVPITAAITIKALTGYLTSTATQVAQAVTDAINANGIGHGLSFGRLYNAANSVNSTYSVESLAISRTGSPTQSDVAMAYNEMASCVIGSIAMTVT